MHIDTSANNKAIEMLLALAVLAILSMASLVLVTIWATYKVLSWAVVKCTPKWRKSWLTGT